MNEIQGMLHISSSAGVVGGWRMGGECDHCFWGMVVDGLCACRGALCAVGRR